MKYFIEILVVYREFRGTELGSPTTAQILSNMANIQTLLQTGLESNHSDLKGIIFCILDLNMFSRISNGGITPLLDQIPKVLPHPCDHHLAASFITELFASGMYRPISAPEEIVAKASEHFEHLDDSDLECRLLVYILFWED
jgi:hypothetical protein